MGRPPGLPRPRCRLHGLGGAEGLLDQPPGFIQVGRNQRGQGKQRLHQGLGRFLGDQAITAGGHHHRIQYHLGHAVTPDAVGHHAHGIRGGQHADFDGIDPDILHNRIDLRTQHGCGNAMNGPHTLRVLRGDGGNGRHAIATQGRKRL